MVVLVALENFKFLEVQISNDVRAWPVVLVAFPKLNILKIYTSPKSGSFGSFGKFLNSKTLNFK